MNKINISQRDRNNLADIVWYIKGQLDILKLNYDYSSIFNQDHVNSLTKFMNLSLEKEGLIDAKLQTLDNHWIIKPIESLEELAKEAKGRRAVYNQVWGIKPAQVILNMQGSVLSKSIESKQNFKLSKK